MRTSAGFPAGDDRKVPLLSLAGALVASTIASRIFGNLDQNLVGRFEVSRIAGDDRDISWGRDGLADLPDARWRRAL